MVYFLQTHLIFQPTRELGATPADQGLAFEDAYISTADGQRLHAWFVPHPAAAATVLFLHGNAGNIADRPLTLTRLHELKLNVLMLEYRGYGLGSGRPSEHSTDDEVIPFRHGQLLLQSAPEPKSFYRLVGPHNEAFMKSGSPYYRLLGQFIGRTADDPEIDDKIGS